MIGEPLISDSRLARIEEGVRRTVANLPLAARFVTYMQEPTEAMQNGIVVPVSKPMAVLAVVTPDPLREGRERWVRGTRTLEHFEHFEKQRDRIVGAPDVVYSDFLSVARRAAQMYHDALALNP